MANIGCARTNSQAIMRNSYPILLNGWKHHKGFIQQQVARLAERKDQEKLKQKLLMTGNSLMDLYTGILEMNQIKDEVVQQLNKKNHLSPEEFLPWINQHGEYVNITLSDQSTWTIRKGNDPEKYIHIHPGRYSPHTIRVKSMTLKSAIFILYFTYLWKRDPFNLDFVNNVRQNFLDASPLKNIHQDKGLGKVIDILMQK